MDVRYHLIQLVRVRPLINKPDEFFSGQIICLKRDFPTISAKTINLISSIGVMSG